MGINTLGVQPDCYLIGMEDILSVSVLEHSYSHDYLIRINIYLDKY